MTQNGGLSKLGIYGNPLERRLYLEQISSPFALTIELEEISKAWTPNATIVATINVWLCDVLNLN